MNMASHSHLDKRKSSNYFSTITLVVLVMFCLIGACMLLSASVPVQYSGLSIQEITHKGKRTVPESDPKMFGDSSDNLPQDVTKEDYTEVPGKDSGNAIEDNMEEKEVLGSPTGKTELEKLDKENQEENSVKDGKTETQEESNIKGENDGDGKGKYGESSSGDGERNSKAGEMKQEAGKTNKTEQIESEENPGERKFESDDGEKKGTGESAGGIKQDHEKVHQTVENPEKSLEKNRSDNNKEGQGDQAEILEESTTEKGFWSTQAVESQNEKILQNSSATKNQIGYGWKLCNATAGPDYIPCLDNLQAIRKLRTTAHYEHRERHCPDQAPTCLVPLPQGYRRSIKWPKSREKIWYYNVPHPGLVDFKGHQNWVKVTGEYFTFPGGGTQFKHGARHYIDFIQNSHPDIAWGNRSRVILDVGCGVASFGGYLLERDVLAMSFAPKDEHEAQVQFALERGIPAILSVMGTKRLPFPSSVFDLVHCSRCRVPWHIEGGKLLLELNRVLRPGGYFVWSATPVYQKHPEDVGIWEAMSELTRSLCWDLVVTRKDKLNGIGAAIYRKPTSNRCYDKRPRNEPPLCVESDDPNAAWNVPLQACIHRVPEDASKRGTFWPELWPLRLERPPYWLNSQVGVYGKAAPEDFTADYLHWKNVVSQSYLNVVGIDWSSVRNVMDMRALYGGAERLRVWVMNVVPIDSPDTLPIIYERGLFGIYHDWCESFNTYPRTYDLLHADHLFSSLKNRCNLVAVIAEVDRILRPEGKLIMRDNVAMVSEVKRMAESLKWEIRMIYTKDNEGLLCVQKTFWRPTEAETVTSAIVWR